MLHHQNKKHLSSERGLSAILFADIAGITSMMQKDEVNANILLEKFHNTRNTKVENHQGQILYTIIFYLKKK